MSLDLDTFLTTVYCTIDDLYQEQFAHLKPIRPGHRPELSDSGVLSLMLLAQWHPMRSERAFLRHARDHWRACYPRMVTQSAFNRRTRDLRGVMDRMLSQINRLAEQLLGESPVYEVMDTAAVRLMRRCRGVRHRLFGDEAAIGRGGSDKEWYYGIELLLAVSQHSLITGFAAGPADTEERWLAEAMLRWRTDPEMPAHRNQGRRIGPSGPVWGRECTGRTAGCVCFADLGFRGKAWVRHWLRDLGTAVLTSADYAGMPEEARRRSERWLSGLRQVVETVFSLLNGLFGLQFPRARTFWGLRTRICAKMVAFDIAVYINHLFKRPTFAIFNPFD